MDFAAPTDITGYGKRSDGLCETPKERGAEDEMEMTAGMTLSVV